MEGNVMSDDAAVKYLEKGMSRIETKIDSMLEHCEKQCVRIQNNKDEITKAKIVMWVLSAVGGMLITVVAFAKNIVGLVG